MGMSASQARLLSLQARQSNLEYQGQQINQERTILSQQCTALYNSLLSMTVPTPPATTDYQTIKYTGELGATKYSFDANSIKPNGTGDTYTITMQEQKHGDSLQKNAQIATVSTNAGGSIKAVDIDPKYTIHTESPTNKFKTDSSGTKFMNPVKLVEETDLSGNKTYKFPSNGVTYYTKDGGTYSPSVDKTPNGSKTYYALASKSDGGEAVSGVVESGAATATDGALVTADDLKKIYIKENGQLRAINPNNSKDIQNCGDGTYRLLLSGVTYVTTSESENANSYTMQGDIEGVTVAGKGVHKLSDTEKQDYGDAIANCGLKDANGNAYTVDDFYMYYNDKGGAVFVLISDVEDGNNNAVTYNYAANGEFTKNQSYDDAKLTFDPTNGRITEIAIPNYDDNGNVASWTSISVKAETVTDEAAYNDAYAQYEYDTYLYDQKNKEINAKTEVIQQEDKNLELKLQRLDNERTQITTEIEAVKKVINDNIEGSYKTFSG